MVPYGGFWWRVLAYLIDAILLQIALSILTGFLGLGVGFNAALMGGNEDLIMGPMVAASVLISFVAQWLYFALLESSKMQATVGKLAIGLVVTDLDGQRISFGRATGRYFAKILSGVILLIGYIMVAFTQRKQGLHDMIASTLVYKTRDPREVAEGADVFA